MEQNKVVGQLLLVRITLRVIEELLLVRRNVNSVTAEVDQLLGEQVNNLAVFIGDVYGMLDVDGDKQLWDWSSKVDRDILQPLYLINEPDSYEEGALVPELERMFLDTESMSDRDIVFTNFRNYALDKTATYLNQMPWDL